MASHKQKLELQHILKPLLKIVLFVAIAILILYKLFGYLSVGHNESPLPAISLNEEINNLLQQEKVRFNQQAQEDDVGGNDVLKTPDAQQLNTLWNWTDSLLSHTYSVFVLIPFCKARNNVNLQTKFRTCVTSMLELSSADVVLFIAGDAESRVIAEDIVSGLKKKNVEVRHVDVEDLGARTKDTITAMQKHFSYNRPGAQFADTLFFISTILHRVAPPALRRLIMLDSDLRFHDDIRRLHHLFTRFLPSNVMGVAHENQPVYRHVLSAFRQANPGTRVGEPPPSGLPGFNSGVLLLDLERMRRSERYNALLEAEAMRALAEKYAYKGHLGDQDFYSLAALENEDLFFVLPCGWNRQLCQWWRDKGYGEVFDSYYRCPGSISVYHGNCDTPFPDE